MKGLVRRITGTLIPRRCRPLSPGNTIPACVLLAVTIVTCLWLEQNAVITFTRFWPFAWLGLVPWLWWVWMAGQDGLSPVRSQAALLLRMAIFSLLVATLAEPRTVRRNDQLAVVFAVDVSGSVNPEAVEQARDYVARVGTTDKPLQDSAGLLYFGRNAAVQQPPRLSVSHEEMKTIDVPIHIDGSNLAQALSLSSAVLPEDQNGRIVLISDGVATEGELSPVLGELAARKIAVDILPIEYTYSEEVWIERLDLPDVVQERQTYEASVILSSLKAGNGRLILQENNQVVIEQEVSFKAGKNRFQVPIHLREPGHYEYTVQIVPTTGDHIRQNNVGVGSVFLEGQGKILLVTQPGGDSRDWEPLLSTLTQASFRPELTSANLFPTDPLVLKAFDCVVFVNVAHEVFEPTQLQALHDAVYHQGVGFLMVGGPRSFGPGGWAKSPVEKVLPVEMELTNRKVLLNGALVIVLDHSGSMGEPVPGASVNKQQMADLAAAAAITSLQARDWLGVVIFDSTAEWVVPFALNTAPEAAARAVRAIGPAGGTNMYPALEQALDALEGMAKESAAIRHIVLLTDGQSQPGDLTGIVARCRDARISITTIGIGAPQELDVDLLGIIANETGGRFYPVMNAGTLPRILVHEATTLRRAAIREDTFTPTMSFPSPIMKGINGVPPLHGLVVTVPRQRVELLLEAPAQQENGVMDPVLAVHLYGVGRTAALTTDLTSRWGKSWMEWDHFQPLIQQLMLDLSRPHQQSDLKLRSFAVGTEGVIDIEDHGREEMFRELHARVRDPQQREQSIRLQQTGPRRYQARFPLNGEGRYALTVTNGQFPLSDGFVVPYSQEYLRFTANHLMLQQIANETGGRLLTGNEQSADIYGVDRLSKLNTQSIFAVLLQILAFLIPLDVGLRRIQFDGSRLRNWFGKSNTEKNVTLDTLLVRKQQASASLDERKLPEPPIRSTSSTRLPDSTSSGTETPGHRLPQTASPDSAASTTARLRERLNRHREHRDDG